MHQYIFGLFCLLAGQLKNLLTYFDEMPIDTVWNTKFSWCWWTSATRS